MARTPSNMIPLGTEAPAFRLPDTVSGTWLELEHIKGDKATVIMFICNHCPFVKHVNSELVAIANTYTDRGISFAAISSNDIVNYPEDSPEMMKKTAAEEAYPFPYLYDETQEIAKAYHAACTPDFYVFDSNLKLVYRGQLDDSRPGNDLPLNGDDLRNALNAVLNGGKVNTVQKPSIGCNIKWIEPY